MLTIISRKIEGIEVSLDIYLVDKIYEEYTHEQECYWTGNITHNLNKMAMAISAYHYLWRPEEVGVVYAKDNIINLRQCIGYMYLNYDKLREMNPENGWGNVNNLIDFTTEYLKACEKNPEAIIEVCR